MLRLCNDPQSFFTLYKWFKDAEGAAQDHEDPYHHLRMICTFKDPEKPQDISYKVALLWGKLRVLFEDDSDDYILPEDIKRVDAFLKT